MPLSLSQGMVSCSWQPRIKRNNAARRLPNPAPPLGTPDKVVQNADGTAWHVYVKQWQPAKRKVSQLSKGAADKLKGLVGKSNSFSGVDKSIVPGPGDMTPRGSLSRASSGDKNKDEAATREVLRTILARQDLMEARQAEVMLQLEQLGRQVSMQQETLQGNLADAKTAMSALTAMLVASGRVAAPSSKPPPIPVVGVATAVTEAESPPSKPLSGLIGLFSGNEEGVKEQVVPHKSDGTPREGDGAVGSEKESEKGIFGIFDKS